MKHLVAGKTKTSLASRKLRVFLLFVTTVVLLYCIINTSVLIKQAIRSKAPNYDAQAQAANPVKYVLYWSPFWHMWDYQMGYGFEPFKNCEYKNCFATRNRSLLAVQDFDALIFHATYYKSAHGVPSARSPRQIYIFMNWEAPVYVCPDLKQYAGYFNWTMSYRFDSDLVRRHGYIFKEQTDYKMPSKAFVQNKTALVAWFVSHCETSSRRETLCSGIQKYMSVDIYGMCGKLKCSRKKDDPKISSDECYDMVEQKYKFYLSFENSYCRDYATEKLYNILLRDVVPIVYGAGDYKVSAPPNSVINVKDFENASKLVDYLNYLDKNIDEYLKYFEWKKNYRVKRTLEPSACQICKKLHQPLRQSIYYDLHEWWWGPNKSICKTGKALPKIVSDLLSEGTH